jgi:hypothetical protein
MPFKRSTYRKCDLHHTYATVLCCNCSVTVIQVTFNVTFVGQHIVITLARAISWVGAATRGNSKASGEEIHQQVRAGIIGWHAYCRQAESPSVQCQSQQCTDRPPG